MSGPAPSKDQLRRLARRADHLAARINSSELNYNALTWDRAELSALQRVLVYFDFDELPKEQQA